MFLYFAQQTKRKKKAEKYTMSETNPFFTSLSHLAFSHLNFHGTKWNILARSLCPMTESIHLQNYKVTLESSEDKHPKENISRELLLESICPPKFEHSCKQIFFMITCTCYIPRNHPRDHFLSIFPGTNSQAAPAAGGSCLLVPLNCSTSGFSAAQSLPVSTEGCDFL